MNKISISDNALMAIAELTKVLAAYVFLKQTFKGETLIWGKAFHP